jgi:pyrimidine-nucleoside phosphorylase
MKTLEDAKLLAQKMESLGKYAGREVKSVFTPMNEPIGFAVGNSLEIIEAINFLKGKNMPEDLKRIVLEIGSYMIKLAGKGDSIEENKQKMLENIYNGLAFNKFKEMVQNQGGDISYLDDVEKFEKAKFIIEVKSDKNGQISEMNAEDIGKLACFLGAGRVKKEDKIDMTVGIILNKKVNDFVEQDETLATIYANDEEKCKNVIEQIRNIIKI